MILQNTDNIQKAYKTGYVPGVFDLFHIGHLNLIRRCKERSEYLIVGVLTDELVEYYKHKRPYIPYQERAEIVAALKYVDKVVPVDFSNTDKMDAWNEICERLRAVGSNMEFFPYTEGTSSTQIKALIQTELNQK